MARFKDSGLKVNAAKTEICVFSNKTSRQIELIVGAVSVKSKPQMNVQFDSCLSWSVQVASAIVIIQELND